MNFGFLTLFQQLNPVDMKWMQLFAALFLMLALASTTEVSAERSFAIDYDHNTFVKDGQPFRYISGSMHYARVHPLYWQDRLTKMYMAGLDAVQTYVPWNLHEPKQGTFNFEGQADIESFLQVANATGLLVILRAGPYICGEWDMGGLPSWLLRNPDVKVRTSQPDYLKYVDLWMGVLLPKMKPYLYANGGPIITVQIENEYGSYSACDHEYMRHLLQLFQSHLGTDVVYFSTDGPSDRLLKCGTLQGIYATVDFGIGGSPQARFNEQRKFEPKGPLVNSEYYTGWLDHWGEKHQTRSTKSVVQYLDEILGLGANVNMYMFEGGTNFAYWNGANGGLTSYSPQPTTYDYDAPLTEPGDPNEKYMAIRTLIGKYKKLPPGEIPPPTPKYAYGKTTMTRMSTLYDALDQLCPYGPILTDYPISMEAMQQDFGFMLYRTHLKADYTVPTTLIISGIHDRGYVLVDQNPMGILQRNTETFVNITGQADSTLDILVENMGRLNYGCCINDSKGIISNVTLGGVVLKNWQIYSLDLERALPSSQRKTRKRSPSEKSRGGVPSGPLQIPSFFVGTLPSGPEGPPQDTFLMMTGWSKGQAFINGFNLGRYWPVEGPQITLYVPAKVLTSTTNTLVLFETEHSPCNASDPSANCLVEFIDRPIINSTIPPPGNAFPQSGTVQELEAGAHLPEEGSIIEEELISWEDMALESESLESRVFSSEFEVDLVAEAHWAEDETPLMDLVGGSESSESELNVENINGEGSEDKEDGECDWVSTLKNVGVSLMEIVLFLTSIPNLVWQLF